MRNSVVVIALACAGPWLVRAAGAAPACGFDDECPGQTDEASLLQALGPARNLGASLLDAASISNEALRAESDEVHVTWVIDCHSHNMWQSELLFFTAQRVGQKGPITQILSGCKPERREYVEKRHASLGLPKRFKVSFVPEFNDKSSHVINKVYGFEAWFRGDGPSAKSWPSSTPTSSSSAR